MDGKSNTLNWFEIYVNDLDRAKKFYEEIFNVTMHEVDMGGMKMVPFPMDEGVSTVSGALIKHEMRKPGNQGPLVYLNANPDLQQVVDRIEKAGGKVERPKTLITEEIGYMALFTDSEGNGLALHSNK